VRGLTFLPAHVHRVDGLTRLELDGPALAGSFDSEQAHVGDASLPRRLPDGALCGLNREGVARASAVERQVDLPLQSALEHWPRLRGADAAVVDAVGKRDEIASEPIAADVGRLPHPLLVDLLAHRVVERPAVLRAAAVVLAVRADEEKRMVDRIAGAREVDLEQVVVAL